MALVELLVYLSLVVILVAVMLTLCADDNPKPSPVGNKISSVVVDMSLAKCENSSSKDSSSQTLKNAKSMVAKSSVQSSSKCSSAQTSGVTMNPFLAPMGKNKLSFGSKSALNSKSDIGSSDQASQIKSSGSGYYAVLMKQMKVKSVSQYGI